MQLSKNIKYIIITHGGGDGICAAAIAVSKLEDPIDIYFSQTYTINGLIRKLIRTNDVYKLRIYILDLHINDDLITLLKRFNKVVYIDHNPNSVNSIGMFPGKIDQYKSSSQLAAEYFSALKSPLATLGTVCDKLLTLPSSDPMLKESMLLQKSIACSIDDEEFRKYLVEQLASGLLPSQVPGVIKRGRCTDDQINRLLKMANENILEVNNPKCAITYVNKNIRGFGRQVAHRLISKRNYPVFLIYPDIPRNKIIIIARNNYNLKKTEGNDEYIDLAKFMNIYFSGGGHYNAAGGVIEGLDNPAVQMVKECFEEFIRVDLGS